MRRLVILWTVILVACTVDVEGGNYTAAALCTRDCADMLEECTDDAGKCIYACRTADDYYQHDLCLAGCVTNVGNCQAEGVRCLGDCVQYAPKPD